MSTRDERWLVEIARRLDRLWSVPTAVLESMVRRRCTCLRCGSAEPPDWLEHAPTDRDLAARLCEGCEAQDECLELELRLAGADTVGVWGGLSEDDRRALHSHWLRRREAAGDDQPDPNDGGRS
jgi:WhiB family redox-sensing transcriptional regulator